MFPFPTYSTPTNSADKIELLASTVQFLRVGVVPTHWCNGKNLCRNLAINENNQLFCFSSNTARRSTITQL